MAMVLRPNLWAEGELKNLHWHPKNNCEFGF